MTARIFAYVTHKGGVPDDCAAEMLDRREESRSDGVPGRRCHRRGSGTRYRLQQPALNLCGDMEDR